MFSVHRIVKNFCDKKFGEFAHMKDLAKNLVIGVIIVKVFPATLLLGS